MPLDRLEAAHDFLNYLWQTRSNGRWNAVESLFGAWQREAPGKYFVCLGQQLADLADRRRRAPVINFSDRRRQREERGTAR
jgi:hypothetical protein